jgi:hypothetical protein
MVEIIIQNYLNLIPTVKQSPKEYLGRHMISRQMFSILISKSQVMLLIVNSQMKI